MQPSRRDLGRMCLAAPLAQAATKLSVLVIDGINNHDWKAGTRVIRSVLEATGRFTVDASTSPGKDAPASEWQAWQPNFRNYDVVVNNFNGGHLPDGVRWPRRVEESLEAYLAKGGGFASFHAANNAFLQWDAYNEIIGLGWRDISFGPGLIVDEGEKVVVVPAEQDLPPGHGAAHDFVMTMMDARHPITLGLPKRWLHPMEQLTHGQHAPKNPKHGALEREVRVLTYAYSKDSHRREPMDWVRGWDRGRIYVTMLGHTWRDQKNPNCRCAGFQTLLARGVEWAASGKVTIPVPARFPTPDEAVFTDVVEV